MNDILKAIYQIEDIYGLTDRGLSMRLGLDPSYVSQLRSGRAKPGKKFLKSFVKEFPEVKLIIYQYLMDDDPNGANQAEKVAPGEKLAARSEPSRTTRSEPSRTTRSEPSRTTRAYELAHENENAQDSLHD